MAVVAFTGHKQRGWASRLTPDQDGHAPLGLPCKQGSKHVLATAEETKRGNQICTSHIQKGKSVNTQQLNIISGGPRQFRAVSSFN